MQFSFNQTLVLLSLAVAAHAAPSTALESRITERKANEYKSSDCSGPLNYGHHAAFLPGTSMDPTTNSVYLANGPGMKGWAAYDGTAETGGNTGCTGNDLSVAVGNYLPGGCVNLNTYIPGHRISCVAPATDEAPEGPLPTDLEPGSIVDPEV